MSEERVVIVTGAGSGIGRELTLQALRKGFRVLAVTRHRSHLDELGAAAASFGDRYVPMEADITAPEIPARIVETARARFGRIDVIINNAGFATSGRLLEQSDRAIDEQWQVHLAAPLRIMRAALPMLQERHGQVFFTGSGLARVPSPYYGAYCAAKAAVRAAATQLRRELYDTGVAVTYIDPGSVRTAFAETAGIKTMGPDWVPATPEFVASKILRAIDTRPKAVNAVWWHTLSAMLGEWFHGMTDRSMRSMPVPDAALHAAPPPSCHAEPQLCHAEPQLCHAEPVEARLSLSKPFDEALAPLARRMERVNLPQQFLVELLRPGDDVQLADAAMRWAGMPNKNERAALNEALDALTNAGFLERTGDERWRVLRSASAP